MRRDDHKKRIDFQTLVMKAEDGICRLDENFIIRFVNPRMLHMLGFTDETELIGKKFSAVLAPEERRLALKRFYSRKEGNAESYEIHFKRKNGSLFPAALSPAPLFEEGVFAGSFATIKDITRQKLLLDQLRASEARFKDLVEQLPAAVCEIASDQSIRYLNDSAHSLFNLKRMRSSPEYSLRSFIPMDELPRLDRLLGEAFAGRTQEPFPMDVCPPGAERIPALWSAAPADRRNSEDGLRIVIIDIQEVLSSFLLQMGRSLDPYGLTEREKVVAKLLIVGLRYKEIAFKLRIALPTVRTHIQSLYGKINIHSRDELVDIVGRKQAEYYGDNSLIKKLKRALFQPR